MDAYHPPPPPTPKKVFQFSEKTIYSKELKHLAAVPLFSTNIVSIIFDVPLTTINFHVGLTEHF